MHTVLNILNILLFFAMSLGATLTSIIKKKVIIYLEIFFLNFLSLIHSLKIFFFFHFKTFHPVLKITEFHTLISR